MQKGETKKACPGCGTPGLRKIDEVCAECKKKLQEADEARQRRERDTEHQVYQVPRRFPSYVVPAGYHTRGNVRAPEEAITRAMEALVLSIGAPVAGRYFPAERLFYYPKGYRVVYDYPSGFLMFRPATAQAVDQLDSAIQAALEAAYQAGKGDGSHLLMQLADGDLTVGDFNKRVEPSKSHP
jgi:hypothetical protein